MSELLITAVWLVTLCVVVFCAMTEIAKLLSVDDVPRGRRNPDGGTMYFDVSRVEREALVSARARRLRRAVAPKR
jgi:hypothetical protein